MRVPGSLKITQKLWSAACTPKQLNLARNFGTYKTSTGLVGLPVDPDGLKTVHKLSAEVLESVKKIPAESEYRTSVEQWFSYISKVVASTEDVKLAEDTIGLGQIEEVATYCQDELSLIDYYCENKIWEDVAEAKRTAEAVAVEMADVINFTTPPPQPTPVQPPK